jgi:hypothetical protein
MMRWLLYAIARESELEYVLGDLDEEYAGVALAAALRVRSGEGRHAVVAGLAGAAMPLWLSAGASAGNRQPAVAVSASPLSAWSAYWRATK